MSKANGYATPDELFGNTPKRRYADVVVQGRKFRLRSLTALEHNGLDAEHVIALSAGDKEGARKALETLPARRIAAVCCDANGDRIFGDKDVDKILGLPSAFVSELASACDLHLAIPVTVEDAEKN